ncbi:MAG: FAD-dependent oxidoreductase [Alphaproteobacteria bacterium]|nr:FAD-dependent oxidoreductase [Alphaproteobacteria bacterium]
MTVSVAIIGTGPAGFYTADALIKKGLDCTIDLIDRLPTPYGLIRFGVAPDHQTTKKVSRAFEKTALADRCRFFGNVEVGRDISLPELQEMYDAVVLAVGAGQDRHAGIPGEDKKGVIGSAAFVGWYNAHPDLRHLNPDLNSKSVAVIGNGNVAIDIARVLVKTREEMADSDLPEYAAAAIEASPITDVYMLGRRGPIEAKFTNVELREMGELKNAVPLVDPAQLPDEVGALDNPRDQRLKEKNLATLKEFTRFKLTDAPKHVHFSFYANPVEILGGEHVEGIRLEKTRVVDGRATGSGEFFEIECGLVIPAVGYRSLPVADVPFDEKQAIVVHEDGRVVPGVYAVGWVKRGPSGVISTNRPDGALAADHIAADCGEGGKPGRTALAKCLSERGVRVVTFDDWKAIESAEVAAAPAPSPRRKIETVPEMLAVLST